MAAGRASLLYLRPPGGFPKDYSEKPGADQDETELCAILLGNPELVG